MDTIDFLTKMKGFDYDIEFAVSEDSNHSILICSKPSLTEREIFDGVFLEDNIDNLEEIPKEAGIYSAIINVKSVQSYELDWDMIVKIKDIKKIKYG